MGGGSRNERDSRTARRKPLSLPPPIQARDVVRDQLGQLRTGVQLADEILRDARAVDGRRDRHCVGRLAGHVRMDRFRIGHFTLSKETSLLAGVGEIIVSDLAQQATQGQRRWEELFGEGAVSGAVAERWADLVDWPAD
jgi:hypothetical protein